MTPTQKYLLVGCASLALLGIIGVVGLGVWLYSSPEGGVRLSNEMEKYALDYLAEHQLLNPGEKVLAYYDVTLSMDGTEAAILTKDRVIYHKETGTTTSIPIQDIRDVRHRYETLIGDVIEVESTSGEVIKIEIAPLNQGETFKNVLMNLWQDTKDAAGAQEGES
jgi:hypothetical protein